MVTRALYVGATLIFNMKFLGPRFDDTLGETLFPEDYGKALEHWKRFVAKLSCAHEVASFCSAQRGPQG